MSPRPVPLVLVLVLLATGCPEKTSDEQQLDSGRAAPTLTQAAPALTPPVASVPPPEPPPPPPRRSCPEGMMLVEQSYCIDRWEASLVDKETKIKLSPYYPPSRKLAIKLAKTWEQERLRMGNEKAQQIALPELPSWQREHDPEPMAVSRPNTTPNGYLSGLVAKQACENAGKRLCRAEEWVKACEGDRKQRFPYGPSYVQGACNIFRPLHPGTVLHGNPSIGHLDPRMNLIKERNVDPLLRRTGQTPRCRSEWDGDAAYDMNGNLDEWIEDEHGRFVGGFFSRARRQGCEESISAHPNSYFDYSTGVRCCASPTD